MHLIHLLLEDHWLALEFRLPGVVHSTQLLLHLLVMGEFLLVVVELLV